VGPGSQLVEAACRGDREALSELLARSHPDTRRFARGVCATPEDVEDAVQETLWIVSRKIGSLRVSSAFAAWLFRLVRNECLRLIRLRSRDPGVALVPPPAPGPEQVSIQAALHDDIVAAIAALPFKYRQVLVMRDVEEMTAPQVAETLGLTTEAVKSRLHRARRTMRIALREWGS
jgi:RNA polymerase sigma factor (sigma-70 family)